MMAHVNSTFGMPGPVRVKGCSKSLTQNACFRRLAHSLFMIGAA